MESVEFDVPMLSEGSISETNWNELIEFDSTGEIVMRNRSYKRKFKKELADYLGHAIEDTGWSLYDPDILTPEQIEVREKVLPKSIQGRAFSEANQ